MNAVETPSQSAESTGEMSRLASLLRGLGAAAVALSGVVFLLQGLADLEAGLRHWFYLLLMGLLAGCGMLTRAVFGDAKSARLLLGLAVALVPVQFAELGGLIHTLVTGEAIVSGPFAVTSLGPLMLTGVAALTLIIAPLISFAGFSVLVRPAASPLTWAYLLPNALLLLPWRDSAAGFLVLSALAALVVLTDRQALRLEARSRTLEGRSVRAMSLLPLAIATVRLGFHAEAITGYCALAGFTALAMIYAARQYVANGALREVTYLVAAGLGSLAAAVWIAAELVPFDHLAAWCLLPAMAILLGVGRLSEIGRAYRAFALLFAGCAAFDLATSSGTAGATMALLLGALLLIVGVLRQEREPAVGGVAIMVYSLVELAIEACARIHVNGWLMLATVGVLLVVGASFIERFGRPVARQARIRWSQVSQWD